MTWVAKNISVPSSALEVFLGSFPSSSNTPIAPGDAIANVERSRESTFAGVRGSSILVRDERGLYVDEPSSPCELDSVASRL